MSGFECAATGGGRGLLVRHGSRPVAELAFGLPGAPVPGWEADEEEARLTTDGVFTARLRHLRHERGWTTTVSLDNTTDAEEPLPALGFALTVAPGWVGWSWTADLDGFVVVAPAGRGGQVLRATLRQGFLRAARQSPVFDPEGGDAAGEAAAFHLAAPDGVLRGFGRHTTTLEFGAVEGLDAVASRLPDWLPTLVADAGDEVRFQTPDLAVVPGVGASVAIEDTAAVVTGGPGHREVAVHGVRGVHRVRATFTPALEPFLAEWTAAFKSRRPRATSTATGAVVASALARRAVWDAEATLDWLEHEDWLTREGPLGPAIAAVVATETGDKALLEAACAAVLAAEPAPGLGIVATRCWLGCLRLGVPPLDLTRLFAGPGADPRVGLEWAVLRNTAEGPWADAVGGLVRRLGAELPGQPVGLSEADAGLAAAVLRLVPEGWGTKRAATAASEKTVSLLLADHADGLQPRCAGLAWLLLGDIGA